jgi:DNA-binding IclR family transcriptional regulator
VSVLKTPSPPAIDRALAVLELISQANRGLTLPEIADRLDLPKSSTHTILLALERREFLRRNSRTRRYLFGPKLFSLANRALGGLSLREFSATPLKELMTRTGLSVHMAIIEEDQAVIVDQYAPPSVVLHTWVGKRMELHCTALGKVLLAWLPEVEVTRILGEHRLGKHNENTKSSPRRILVELQETRRRGYAIDDEEAEIGTRCLGAPVFDPAGNVTSAISVSGTTGQLHFVNAASIATQLRETATRISELVAEAEAAAVTV